MRELKWYSYLYYNLGGGIEKKFYMRPDGRIRNQDLAWVDENWPSVRSVSFIWYKVKGLEKFNEYSEFKERPSESRTKGLSEEEFVGVF